MAERVAAGRSKFSEECICKATECIDEVDDSERKDNARTKNHENFCDQDALPIKACREERRAKNMKGRMYRQERTRKRVMETTDIRANYCTEA